jgi:hypothetical protein
MAAKQIRYRKNRPQTEFHDDIETKFLHLSMGFGGGKTYSLIQKAFQLSYINRPYPGGLICPTFTDFRSDVLPLMEDILDENRIRFNHHKTEHWFKFPWSKGKLYYKSAEKNIRGPNWAYALVNEVTLIPAIRYKEVIGRVRLKHAPHPQVCTSGTPEGTSHWAYEKFILEPMPNSRVIYGSSLDNQENISEGFIQSLYDSYDQVMVDAYIKGLWVNMLGKRFYYSYDPDKSDDKKLCRRNENALTHIGMDFNVYPMAATMWHFDGIKARAYDEIRLDHADTRKMVDALHARRYNSNNCLIYPDPSGNAESTKGHPDIYILKQAGFEVKFKTKAPPMRRRQLHMNNLLDKGIIQLNPDTCKFLKRDFMSVSVDPIDFGKNKKDKELTHYSDGADYLFDNLIPFKHEYSNSREMKYR